AIRARSRLLTEGVIAQILIDQMRRENFISWNSAGVSEDGGVLADFNNFNFHRSAFSWLRPLLRGKPGEKPKPTPVVLDVYGQGCGKDEVDSLLERIRRAGQNKVSRLNILGIIAASDFSEAAWTQAKGAGLLAINLRQHFGDAAFEALAKVQELLKDAVGNPSQANDSDYKQLADILEGLKTNPYVVALRSIGFEMLTGFLLRSEGWEDIQLNLRVPFMQQGDVVEQREVDVFGHKKSKDEIYLVECKASGLNKPVDPNHVRKFFTETVPAFLRSKYLDHVPTECRAEIWTTGQVSKDAEAALAEVSMKRFIKPRILDHAAVSAAVPRGLASCKRFLDAIAVS
ncbi:MAG TPA: hypothetical protein VHI52_13210, partial [Verrucomicrobiae bacterium]|nr:hypothetical protein [Verrucomicrobiae bacterium]